MNNRRHQTLILLFCALASMSLALPHALAQAPSEKLRVAYTVIAPTQASVWTAKEMGYYAKHGLDVELVLLVGAPLAVAALVGGIGSACRPRYRDPARGAVAWRSVSLAWLVPHPDELPASEPGYAVSPGCRDGHPPGGLEAYL